VQRRAGLFRAKSYTADEDPAAERVVTYRAGDGHQAIYIIHSLHIFTQQSTYIYT